MRHAFTQIVPLVAVAALGVGSGAADERPRLLIDASRLPRLRHACGVPEAGDRSDWGPPGRRAADFQVLRSHFGQRVGDTPLPGELMAAAFVHLMVPEDPGGPRRLTLIAETLTRPVHVATDSLELVIALDWCWNGLDAAARDQYVQAARAAAEPLTGADSPLDTRRFRQRLADLALALALDESREPSARWGQRRQQLLEAGQAYFATTLPTFVAWRGAAPTGPDAAAREECDTVLALELGRTLQPDLWQSHAATVGRWLEHYVLARLDHPRLAHQFLRDDAGRAPLTPAPEWEALLPLTAHVLAVRTGNPAAALVARQVEADLTGARAGLLADLWRWVPIVYDVAALPVCDSTRLPTAYNFGGAVCFRGGTGPQATGIWIEAGQPFLRRRQHFDAGHFLFYRGGHLTVSGGDDVVYEAVPSKGGKQRLGPQREPFDFEQYATATVAHNALVLWDAARLARWYGDLYLPAGGQRCLEHTCTDFTTPLEVQERITGRQLAYGQHEHAAYLALDLQPAYGERVVTRYTREFVFFGERALVVIDRLLLPSTRALPTWIVNIPERPTVDDADLGVERRVAGSSNEGGVWRYPDARWLRWTDGDSGLWLHTALPHPRHVRVVGGPARRNVVSEGSFLGRTYVGGAADSFERLVLPAERHGALNAWYRLGAPTLLGPQVGRAAVWGRVEVEPARPDTAHVLIHVLVADRATERTAPEVKLEQRADTYVLELVAGDTQATLCVPAAQEWGGTLTTGAAPGTVWDLPRVVTPDAPLPVVADEVR